MKSVPVSELPIGVEISRDIFNENGNVILSTGTKIAQKHIDYLLAYGIDQVFIREESDAAVTQFGDDAQKRYQSLRDMYGRLVEHSKAMTVAAQTNPASIDFAGIIADLDPVLKLLLEDNDILRSLRNIGSGESYLYTHPVNVSLLAAMLGKWLELEESEQYLLAYAGFFHDIGKARVKQELFFKTDPLASYEISAVREHAMHGYELLKNAFVGVDPNLFSHDMVQEMLQVALAHHERVTGTGYPFGLKGDTISFYARVVAVVDVYDAITSNRYYREGISPYVAFKLLKEESFKGLDATVSQLFLKNISQFFINNRVRLSDGRIGDVVYVNKFALNRPLVKVGDDYIDLSTDYSLDIVEVII
ncbi:MAG: HD domain-containing protein [Bacillota bacterium]|nr:HD domain-containing protein [Bacillota bacterium]